MKRQDDPDVYLYQRWSKNAICGVGTKNDSNRRSQKQHKNVQPYLEHYACCRVSHKFVHSTWAIFSCVFWDTPGPVEYYSPSWWMTAIEGKRTPLLSARLGFVTSESRIAGLVAWGVRRLPREPEESHEGSQEIMGEHSKTIRDGYQQRPTAADHDTKDPAKAPGIHLSGCTKWLEQSTGTECNLKDSDNHHSRWRRATWKKATIVSRPTYSLIQQRVQNTSMRDRMQVRECQYVAQCTEVYTMQQRSSWKKIAWRSVMHRLKSSTETAPWWKTDSTADSVPAILGLCCRVLLPC
jgi:hypothetical protein